MNNGKQIVSIFRFLPVFYFFKFYRNKVRQFFVFGIARRMRNSKLLFPNLVYVVFDEILKILLDIGKLLPIFEFYRL